MSTQEGQEFSNQPLTAREQRRSERVMLRVPLQLSARLPDGQRISIVVKTEIVNAHGGLLSMGIGLEPGQRVNLASNRSAEPVTATILRIEKSELGSFSAAFEFEFPVTDFWPVTFPPDKDLAWIG